MPLATATALQYNDLSAWISVDSQAREVYEIQTLQPNSFTCWIVSESGKKFSVNWRNLTRKIPLQAFVVIDGVVCDTHVMLDAISYPQRPNAVGVYYARTSDLTRRDFMFTSIEVTDDDAYLHTVGRTYKFGTITLELWRIHVDTFKPLTKLEHQPDNPVLEAQLVHERSKKAGTHHVKYGEEYFLPAPVVDVVTTHALDSAPYATFTFKYRPIGRSMLMANGIVPRPIPVADRVTTAEIRALEVRLAALRSRASQPGDDAPLVHRKIKTESGVASRTRRPVKDLKRTHNRTPPEIIDLTDD
ncbi:hypothetical protein D9615_009963 [Tricholomella constricta]|uniref:DUF7918 domain-containing protein n=1 Tax=Tricholomella constricta TaxID=117010 RepID=A0A8H5LTQ1_9AGAR|nr:hypothetical protein D9615_009963 [Tricholomella constricta]